MARNVSMRLDTRQSESAVLGAIISDGSVNQRYGILPRVSEHLQPSDFYVLQHRDIYQAMLDLQAHGTPVDLVTVVDCLEETGKTKLAGGVAYVARLIDGEINLTNVEYYAQMVKRHAARRQIQAAVEDSSRAIKAGDATNDVIDAIQESLRAPLEALDDTDPESGTQAMRQIAARAYERLERIQDGSGSHEVFTGYNDLDSLYAPSPGNLVVIGARTGVGKTALALGIAENIVSRGEPIYYLSREMPMTDLAFRLMSHIGGVNLGHFGRKGGLTSLEWNSVSATVNRIYSMPFYCSRHGRPAEAVSVAHQLLKSSEPIKAMFVDYLGLLDLPQADRHDLRLESAVKMFTELAKSTGLVVYLLVQVRRLLDGTAKRRPRIEDLKGSGSIEQAADLIYLLHRPRQDKKDDDAIGIQIAKQRQGPTGFVALKWKEGHVLNERATRGKDDD